MKLFLRPSGTDDIDFFHALQTDSQAAWMAAFVSEDLGRKAFEARWRRVLSEPDVRVWIVLDQGQRVGQVMHFLHDGERSVSYWIARQHWGRGLATRALGLLLDELPQRPVHARAAQDNAGSLAVLRSNGFEIIGHDSGLAAARGEVVAEYLLRLDR